MFKQIEICDRCQCENQYLYHYTIPYPETIYASGGHGNPPLIKHKGIKDKEIALCGECRNALKEASVIFLHLPAKE